MVLGDFGADVVKVEPPGGDPARSRSDAPLWLRGKRSVVLDAARPADREQLGRLAGAADVLVTTFAAVDADAGGFGFAAVSTVNPALVYCRISGFGPKGPYAAYPADESLVAAKSGRMRAFGGVAAREGPGYAAVHVGVHACTQASVAAIVAALREREESGRGQLVETSLLQAMLPYDLLGLVYTQLSRAYPHLFPTDPAPFRAATLNYHPLPTKDGRWLQMGNLLQHLFDNFLVAAGMEDVLADPRFSGPTAAWAETDREALRDRMLMRFKERTAGEWMQTMVAHGGVAATEYRTTQEALDDPDLVMNGHVVECEHPDRGRMRQPGVVVRLCETPGTAGFAFHDAGADQAGAASLWREERTPRTERQQAGAERSTAGPLAGVTILEFATIIAAPLGVSMLADLGARVIKVEPVGGDPYRGLGLLGIMASKTNVSKESIAVDLKRAEGRAIVDGLIRGADALIHNYRPGVPERLGIGYQQCRALRPGIVHVAVNGYGPLGPGARRPSTHPIPGAAVGGATLQAGGAHLWVGETLDELRAIAWRLFRANEANPDPNTSVVVASAATLALLAQRRYGIGQQVFVDMLGANAYANADDFLQYRGKPERPSPDVDLYGLSATHRLYPAREGWVFLALPRDVDFRRFCALAGADGLCGDARFATEEARRGHDDRLAAELVTIMGERTADEWEALLAPQGVGCVRADGPTPGEFWLEDEHVRENGFVVTADHARYGEYLRWGPLATLHGTPAVCGPGALGGDKTEAILVELGYRDEEIVRLFADGVVWSEEVAPLG